jgi:oxygen-independent coproporphyrinogen III oxidase
MPLQLQTKNLDLTTASDLSLYLHIPFCGTRCTYCAFNTYTNMESLIPVYVDALCHELRLIGQRTEQSLHTIYFGGGTPSMLTVDQVKTILATCRTAFTVKAYAEVTIEANPHSIIDGYFEQLNDAGVNRLSIGMQSAHTGELRMFARQHNAEDVAATVQQARQAGFDNISLDLIFGLPQQTLDMWRDSVETALALQPEHLSMYALILEPETAMTKQVVTGVLPTPDDDLAADMYELADALVTKAGLQQYEISNWAKAGTECIHNLQYWRNLPYLGVGAGAHGYAAGLRYEIVKPIPKYLELATAQHDSMPFPLTATVERTESINQHSRAGAMADHMMTGLRLLQEGVSVSGFANRFGDSIYDVYGTEIECLIGYGLIKVDDINGERTLKLTPQARLISNRVFVEFMQG